MLHEEMLRLLVRTADLTMGDDEDLESTGSILAEHGIHLSVGGAADGIDRATVDKGALAKTVLHLLKLEYQRLG